MTTNLANALKQLDGRPISDIDVRALFERTQNERMARVRFFHDHSHTIQNINARTSVFWKFIAVYIIPALGMDLPAHILAESLRPAARVGQLPIKTRRSADPWTDELPSKPWTSMALLQVLSAVVFVGIMIPASLKILMSEPNVDMFDPSLQFLGAPLKHHFTGVSAIDEMFRVIVVAFADAVSWQDAGHSLQFSYLLALLIPILMVWYVEGSRKGSSWTLMSR